MINQNLCKHRHIIIRNNTEYYIKKGYDNLKLNEGLTEYETEQSIIVQCVDCHKILYEKDL